MDNIETAGEGWTLRAPWRTSKGWIVVGGALVICTLLCLHLKLRYLVVFDSVNFALALQHFDVTRHQPQPPGYPGYVLLTKLLHRALTDPTAVFFAAGILGTAVTAYLLARLGEAMGSAKAGIAAAVLLIFNTSNTSSIITSSVRNYLALTSAVIAWLAWLTWMKEQSRKFFFLTAACLGLFSSFRPELAVTLLPLLLFVAVQRKITFKDYCFAGVLYFAGIVIWVFPTARPVGGILPYFKSLQQYFAFHAQFAEQLNGQFSASPRLFMLWKSFVWTFLSVVTWIWVVPFTIRNQCWQYEKNVPLFLASWLVPGFVFSSFVHIGSSGHALASVVAVCLLGGLVVGSIRSSVLFLAALVLCCYGNFLIFKHPIIPYDEAAITAIKNNDRYLGQMTEELLGLGHFKTLFLVTDNSNLTWRTMHYYLPDTPLLDISDDKSGAMFFHGAAEPQQIKQNIIAKFPACGVIAWIVSPKTDLIRQIPNTIIPGWHGLVSLTNGAPGLHLKVSGMTLESDPALCSEPGP